MNGTNDTGNFENFASTTILRQLSTRFLLDTTMLTQKSQTATNQMNDILL